MRLLYELMDIGYLEVESTSHSKRVNVASIVVEEQYQNLGVGTALMKVMLKDADMEGKEVWLVLQPLGSDQLPALTKFYRRLGFDHLGSSGYMRRLPKVP